MDVSLEVFVTVVEKGNFTRAAEELRMTQPAVSQYIQALERTVGAKLLERTNKYVRLNQAGEIVFHHAKDILGMYTRMQTLVDDLLHRASGDLSISASYTFGEYVLPHLLAYMHEVYPLIRPRINIGNTTEVAEAILNHQADIGIVEGEYHHENLHIEAFAEDEMFVIVPNEERYAGKEEICLSELGKETWIVRESGSGTRRAAEHMFTSRHFQPDNKMEFGSTQLIKESVEAGLGVTLLSHWAVRKEISLGTLIMLKPDGESVRRHFSLITQATPYHTKAAEIFLDLLRMNKAFPDSYV
ncbi:LysR family transcriptional regulator [Paenibacillus sp. N3/727]|uniref:LysR family transcriptional regulator n=1 Tax=Paenibacillus sp. N3/727 TaxID=2925845 RepID=UPI001F5391AC|nr:LysR family transcriptional regulator [Paenibacillus sp. N3/727]UNK18232.1 LysR family transcriptional regulator [Paenibacillus sp. N3/727]